MARFEPNKITLEGIKGLQLTVRNCEGCTVNGHPLRDLLFFKEEEDKREEREGNLGGAQGDQNQDPVKAERLTQRRASELLDQTELVLDHVGNLDDVAMNISHAVNQTIASSGQKGLGDLWEAADQLKSILAVADQNVAKLSKCLTQSLKLDNNLVVASPSRKGSALDSGERLEKPHPLNIEHHRSRASSGSSSAHMERPRPVANPLESIFPKKIVEALSCDVGDDVAEHHPSVTVLMSDIVGFTAWCSEVSPTKVIECLSAYFQVIDDLAEMFGVYKVETVGDGYQAITGAPVYTEDHAETMALFALKVIETLPTMRKIFNHEDFGVRVGINSGPIVTGVIRADRIRWQLFGDTVNVASRMESTSVPGRIQISKSTRDLLLFRDAFEVERRGLIDIKGKGQQETFFLNSARETALFRDKSTRKSYSLLSEFIDLDGSKGLKNLKLAKGDQGGGDHPDLEVGSPTSSVDADREAVDASKDSGEPLKQPTVLLVDDLLSILLQYTRVLQREGIRVVTAKNGLEGLEQLKTRKFTCCFCDIHMPKMDGIEMVKLYRQHEESTNPDGQRLPLFALTGNTDLDRNTAMYLSSGFDEVISKTNYKDVLLSYVQNCI
ncbi:adenylate cyclase [Chloropicon primus]|uniref:Adenylate cyclase n=1 Tax=Chloropicon primus TaxID=1764295 RepID=A0A5B8MLG3_9CHLO|nr:adenylate cyclase [Chloropicon primus]UPQ99451.1 adenylate cyclase [Chloropicon primus]|eukprot:QDZ20242.1 adenylate cyclase [Chloropicon primus]